VTKPATERYKALVLGLSILLSACATVPELRAKVEAKLVCCKSPAEFPYAPLATEGLTKITLGEPSPVYGFPTGKSYFAAYSLPPGMSRRLLVRTFITGSAAVESVTYSQVFCPQATFLDSAFRELSTVEKRPSVARGQWAKGIFPSFLSDFDVPPSATYVVFYTNPSSYGLLNMRYAGDGAMLYHPCGPVADAEISLTQ
jgi:hypothetical protein